MVANSKVDVIVVGAGIVGVSIAAHLGLRGIKAALVDRAEIAAATSFGNLGLVERASLYPPAFPRKLRELGRYALNRELDARYELRALPRMAPWLFAYWRASSAAGQARAFAAVRPLFENSVAEHMALAEYAGTRDLYRPGGWLSLYRTPEKLAAAKASARALSQYGLKFDDLDAGDLASVEPRMSTEFAGAVHTKDPLATASPQAVARGIAARWLSEGGTFLAGDARTLRARSGRWEIETASGRIATEHAVIALGPWADVVFGPLGYRVPLGWKRGYHMTYAPPAGKPLRLPLVDVENGYALTAMMDGIRLGTGVEFGSRDGAQTPVQLTRVEPIARRMFPIGERLTAPWMGSRPFIADMIPVIGPAGRHKGLWFAFGHGHHGFTHGPATGRLVAEMIDRAATFCDPAPFDPARFD